MLGAFGVLGCGQQYQEVSLLLGRLFRFGFLLGGSWVVISGATSPLIWVITIVTLLVTLLITTHEPPSGSVLMLKIPGP